MSDLRSPLVLPSPALLKKGIASVRDDLPAGARLNISTAFVRFFRPELEAVVLRPAAPEKVCPIAVSQIPKSEKLEAL